MRWMRSVFAFALVASLLACGEPTGPRLPTEGEEEDKGGGTEPPSGGWTAYLSGPATGEA